MSTETTTAPSRLPDYLASASPNSMANRAPWYLNTAPTFAGIFLWFVFWDQMSKNGLAVGGLWPSLIGVALGALVCHYLFYLTPGLLGMKTGMPLYVVGASTFGAVGGLLMPGFLMGALQFGWLGVNTYASAGFLNKSFGGGETLFYALCVAWAVGAAFVGLKGIQYVAKVATFLPIIPLIVLVMGLALFGGSAFSYKAPADPAATGGNWASILMMAGAIVGFFATAGAAGVDFGLNNRDAGDVRMGGNVGIILAILFTAGVSVLVVAGARATGAITDEQFIMTDALATKLSPNTFKLVMIGLTLASFPGACFSSFIAANSFKTVMPKVNPLISVGIGALVSIALAVTGLAGDLESVFGLIGALFGPICGAMTADYLLNRQSWSGPRAGFNPAGWISWVVGCFVGVMPNLHAQVSAAIPNIPAAPIAAYVVGFVVYAVCFKIGLRTATIEMPQRIDV